MEYALKLIPVLLVFGGLLNVVPLLVFLERKVCAWIQDRVGPNRVGIFGPDSPLEILGIDSGKKRFLGGFMQPLADAIKLFTKEVFVPAGADRLLFMAAPFFALMPPLLAFIIIPVGPDFHVSMSVSDERLGAHLNEIGVLSSEQLEKARHDQEAHPGASLSDILVQDGMITPSQRDAAIAQLQNVKLQVADLHVGILFALAVASLSAYGLAFGGWASNNKYALLGGVRAMAQMISYEIGMGIVILAVVMSFNTVSLRDMVYQQAGATQISDPATGALTGFWRGGASWGWDLGIGGWGIWHQPLAFLLFTICAFAENNRLPFDLAECEAELIGGYHTEYNSMGFGMFFQGEYIAMLSMGALIATMFLGGWHYPFYGAVAGSSPLLAALIGLLVFGLKVFGFIFFSMWVRWTLPRFRWDQLMNIGWKGIVPLALANLMMTALLHLPGQPLKKPVQHVAATEIVVGKTATGERN